MDTAFEIGDVVTIRSDLKEYYAHNLKSGYIAPAMYGLAGDTFTVSEISPREYVRDGETIWALCVIYHGYYWIDEWLFGATAAPEFLTEEMFSEVF